MPARTSPAPEGSGGKPSSVIVFAEEIEAEAAGKGAADEDHRGRSTGGVQQRDRRRAIERDGDHRHDEGGAVDERAAAADLGIDEQRGGGERDEEAGHNRRESTAVVACRRPSQTKASTPSVTAVMKPTTARSTGPGRADIEQRPQPGAERRPAPISSFQSRSRAMTAAAASTIAMKPNSAHWFGACDETRTGVT